ncbi:hypothetical protein ACFL1B_01300 [Nanoarchaeota archaeon]
MSIDILAVEEQSLEVLEEISGVTTRVLVAKHPEHGKVVVKYAHPGATMWSVEDKSTFISVAEKLKYGQRNLFVYEECGRSANVPSLIATFEMPAFWDAVAEEMDLDPEAVRIPTKQEINEIYKDCTGCYNLGELSFYNWSLEEGQTLSLEELKKITSVEAIVTGFIEGEDIDGIPQTDATVEQMQGLLRTVRRVHHSGYAKLDLKEGRNVMRDCEGNYWLHDFGTAKTRSDVRDPNENAPLPRSGEHPFDRMKNEDIWAITDIFPEEFREFAYADAAMY